MDELAANCLLYKPDVICIVETWLDKEIKDSEVNIPNYTLNRLDRNRHGGGIAIYVANNLHFSVVIAGPNFLEFLVICVKLAHGKLGISLLYRPPSTPHNFFDTFSSVLGSLNIPLYTNFFIIW
jgi:hypothetical protein